MGVNTVSIDVDLDEILPEISTEDLQEELERRLKFGLSLDDAKKEIADALRGNDKAHLRIVLNRWMPGLGDMI